MFWWVYRLLLWVWVIREHSKLLLEIYGHPRKHQSYWRTCSKLILDLAPHITNICYVIWIFLLLSHHMLRLVLEDPVQELLVIRVTDLNWMVHFGGLWWRFTQKEPRRIVALVWHKQLECTVQWTQNLKLVNSNFVWREIDFNLFGCFCWSSSVEPVCMQNSDKMKQWTQQRPTCFRFFRRLVQKMDAEVENKTL